MKNYCYLRLEKWLPQSAIKIQCSPPFVLLTLTHLNLRWEFHRKCYGSHLKKHLLKKILGTSKSMSLTEGSAPMNVLCLAQAENSHTN